MGKVDVLVGPVYGLQVHGPDREDPHVRIVAVEVGGRVPRALAGGLKLREVGGTVGVPEVHEVVLDPASPEPADLDVSIAPARRVERADVVPAEEGHLPVHGHEVFVVPEDIARVSQVLRPPQRPEVERVYLLREPLERRGDDDVRETVEDHADHHPLACLSGQGFNEAPSNLVALPDKCTDEDPLLGALYLL